MFQLEQEIDLILDKHGVFTAAVKNWSAKWVPAILEYGGTLSGKKGALVSKARKAYYGNSINVISVEYITTILSF